MNLPVFKELCNSDYIILFLGKILNIPCILNSRLLWQKILRVKPMNPVLLAVNQERELHPVCAV